MRLSMIPPSLALALLSTLGACATSRDAPGPAVGPILACAAPMSPHAQVDLYFGQGLKAGGGVDDASWRRFLDEVVTPRFPDGLSVMEVAGQWRRQQDGAIVRERGKRLTIIVPDAAKAAPALAAIKVDYIGRFQQESVLQVEQPVCAAF